MAPLWSLQGGRSREGGNRNPPSLVLLGEFEGALFQKRVPSRVCPCPRARKPPGRSVSAPTQGSTLTQHSPNRSKAVRKLTNAPTGNFRTTIPPKPGPVSQNPPNCTRLHIFSNSNCPQNPVFRSQNPRKSPQTTLKTPQNPISNFRTTFFLASSRFDPQN